MTEILSLWRAPLDQVALSAAEALSDSQPRCSIGPGEDFSAMTIYNFNHYIIAAGGNTAAALTAMFAAMNPGPYAIGGLSFVPQFLYNIVAVPTTGFFSVPNQCNIIGSGGGGSGTTPFYHFRIDYTSGSIFFNCNSTNYSSGGTYFRSLAFLGSTVTSTADTCIYAATQNCRAVNCTFTDIPVAFNAQADGCALQQCTIFYDRLSGTVDAPVKAVIVAGAQCSVLGPGELFQQARGSMGPTNCTGISIEGAEHTVIANIHLSDWTTGIDFSQGPGAQHVQITNSELQCWTYALNIQLGGGATETTTGIKVTSCMLAKNTLATTNEPNPVVNIDPNGNGNGLLNDITLLDCTVFNMNLNTTATQHGLQIVGGSNIKIIGGTYSNNGSGGAAGIAITGPCGNVQIIGANLQPTYPWTSSNSDTQINNQTYGLLVSGGPVGTIYVSSCDLTGYDPAMGQQAVKVTGIDPHELLIYNCPGYNDLSAPLNGGVAPTSTTNSAASCTTPYFGPSVFIFSSSSPVTLHVFGLTISMSFGIIFVPSPYDVFYFSGTLPTAFSWIGK